MKHILLIAFLSPILALGQVITPVDLTPPSDTPRVGFQKLNTNDANIKARLDSIVNAGLGGGATTVPFDSITDLPTTLSGYGITDAWKGSGTSTFTSDVTIRMDDAADLGQTLMFETTDVFDKIQFRTSSGSPFTFSVGLGVVELGAGGGFGYAASNRGISISSTAFNIKVGSDAVGDIYQRNASGNFSRLAAVATGNVLISGGVATVNSWGKVTSSHIDATVATAASVALKQDAITGLTASGTELNILDGATLSTTELNYVDGVTSAIQPQINSKTTTALTASTGSAIAFDIPRRYGTTASPITGNITYNSTGAVVGQVQTMIHNDSSEPTWGSEFDIISGSYVTGSDNKIMMFLVETGVVWVTISQTVE